MNDKQALKLAIACITGEHPSMRQYTVGANAVKMMGSTAPGDLRDFKKYTQLCEAMTILERMIAQGQFFV